MESRTCTKCGETKPLDAYYFEKGKPRASCKECHRKKVYARDPDRIREINAKSREKYREKNVQRERKRRAQEGDKINERRRELRRENPRYLEVQREWTDANRGHVRERNMRWYYANRELALEWRRRYRQAQPEKHREWQSKKDPEKVSERNRAYYAKNSEKWETYRAKREAMKRQVPHVPYTRQQIFRRDDGICQHCAKELQFGGNVAEIDHIVPLELGGWDVPGNLQLLCRGCNRRKWARLVFTNPARRSVTS